MTTWILIIYFSMSHRSDQAEYLGNYSTKSACEKAASIITRQNGAADDWYLCLSSATGEK